eukprot:30161-Pelagococcus_subviridis.AAC.2
MELIGVSGGRGAGGKNRREEKSLRIGVHRANGSVWEAVRHRTHIRRRRRAAQVLNTSALPPPPNPPAYPVSLLHPDRVRARSPAAETAAETSATLAGDGARKRSNAWSTPPSASHDARYLCSAFSTVIACARYALAVSPAVLLRVRVRVRALAREASVDVSSSGGDASDASDAPSPLRVNAGERTRRSIVRLTGQTKRNVR